MLRVALLGEVSVTNDAGKSVSPPRAQASIAFARLTLERVHGSRREDIADTVWEAELPATWSSALRNILSIVRSFTEELTELVDDKSAMTLRSQDGRYRLTLGDDVEVDIEDAARLASLASLSLDDGDYGAALMNACACAELLAAPFLPSHGADWIREMRQTLEATRLRCLDIASEAALALGDGPTAIRMANEAIRIRPHRESAYRCRMRAEALLGNRAEALATYQQVRTLLSEEVGVDPSPETEAVYLDLLGVIDSAGTENSGTAFPFCGRDREIDEIVQEWKDVQKGEPRVIRISGDAGIGKTRLMLEAGKNLVGQGAIVLFGSTTSCSTHPFDALAMAIGNYLVRLPEDALPRFNRTTARIIDRLLSNSIDEHAPASSGDAVHKHPGWIEIALADALTSISNGRALAVLLDNVGSNGDQTMDLICRAATRPDGNSKTLFIATTRSTVPSESEAALGLSTIGALSAMELSGLDDAALSTILSPSPSRAQHRQRVRKLRARTGGNPFLIRELLAHPEAPNNGAETPPVAVVHYVERLLRALDGQTTALLRAASVLGAEFELALAATVSGIDLRAASALCVDLRRQGILANQLNPAGAQTLRFVNGLVQEVVYGTLDTVGREQLHKATANAVSLRAIDSLYWARYRAHHLERASVVGDLSELLESLWHAAKLAPEQEAVQFCERAMQLMPNADPDLQQIGTLRLGQALAFAGLPTAPAHLSSVATEALGTSSLATAAEAIRSLHQISESAAGPLVEVAAHRISDGALASGLGLGLDGAMVISLHAAATAGRPSGIPDLVLAKALELLRDRLLSMPSIAEGDERLRIARSTLELATRLDDGSTQAAALHEIAMTASVLGNHADAECALSRLGMQNLDPDGQLATLLPNYERLRVECSSARRMRHGPPGDGTSSASSGLSESTESCHRIAMTLLIDTAAEGREPTDAIWALQHLVDGQRDKAALHTRIALASLGSGIASPSDLYQAGLVALTASCLTDTAVAEATSALLLPVADLDCCDGYRSYVGPVSLHLGRLAIVLADWNAAEAHLANASRALTEHQATSWQSLALSSFADVLSLTNHASDSRWVELLRAEAAECELAESH